MPDLITHTAVAHLLARSFSSYRYSIKRWDLHFLFLLGTMLPDLLTRSFYILFPSLFHWIIFFHTPIAMLIVSWMAAALFTVTRRRAVFISLYSGALLHFLLDALQKQIIGNNFWLYPISWFNFSIGIAWPGEIMHFIPLWLVAVLLLESYKYIKR